MTYRELLEALKELTPEQLDMDLAVGDVNNNEVYGKVYLQIVENADILDEGHPLICFE